jgi:hypothetical protein
MGIMYYQFLIITTELIIINSFYINQNISFEQIDIKPDIKSSEYLNGKLYYDYINQKIDFDFKYPSNWRLLEFINLFPSNDKVVFFELKDSKLYNEYKNKQIKNYFNNFYSYFPPTLSILSYDVKFNNISIQEFAKIKIEDLQILFSDFKLSQISNNIKYIGRENIPAWKFEYSIEDFQTSSELFKDKRNGMNIWILRGDKVYEIEYIANEEGYYKDLEEVTQLIDSIRFH